MSSTVIRDFLVALSFKTDDSGAKKSKDALDSNEKSAKLLSRALIALASTAVIAVAKTANELEKLYYSSQRIGSSANNIRAYSDAIAQMGGSAEGALSSLESVARKLRESPGYEGMLKGLGVNTRDQNGQMRDRVEVMKDLSKTLQGMEYYKANAYAGALGIDESTLMAMRDGKFTSEMEKYQKLRKDMGLNDELAKSGQEFAYQWRDMTMQLKALFEVIVMTAGKALIPVLKMLNQLIQFVIHWFAQLNPHIKSFLATGLKIAFLTVVFGGLFTAIAKIAKLLPLLKGLLNVFKALRLVFLASPVGIVLALAAAIALLWDDYQTWKNGGESLIDWAKWSNGLDKAIASIKDLSERLRNLAQSWIEFGKGSYQAVVDGISRNIVEPVMNVVKDPEKTVKDVKAIAGDIKKDLQKTATAVVGTVLKGADVLKGDVSEKTQRNYESIAPIKQGAKGNKQIEFISKYWSIAVRVAKAFNTKPEYILAQFAGETDWGKKVTPGTNYNLGNIKAGSSWTGKTVKAWDKIEKSYDPYRVYDTPEQFADDYIKVIAKAGRYKNAKNAKTAEAFFQALKNAGYATDKDYVSKNIAMVKSVTSRLDLDKATEVKIQKQGGTYNPNALSRFAQNAEVPTNIAPVVPNFSNTQSSNRNVNISQKTDIHITGGDALMTARAVRKEQDAVNLQLTRNSKGLWG